MSQHFLLSRPAKTLTLAQVFRMAEPEAEATFPKVRWPETNGAPVCPSCGGLDAYDCRRPNGAPRFRCRACKGDFSITCGTLFASHKLRSRLSRGHRDLLQRSEGQVSAGALARSWHVLQGAFVLGHKLREAMAEEMKGRTIGGEGKEAEVDGGYFGGYVKPSQPRENRVDRRMARQPKRQAPGRRHRARAQRRLSPGRVPHGRAGSIVDQERLLKGTVVNADEATSWDDLHAASK